MTSIVAEETAALAVFQGGLWLNVGLGGYQVTLDESRSPYIEAQVRVAGGFAALLTDIVTSQRRMRVTLTRDQIEPTSSSKSRTFYLLAHGRRRDVATGEGVLILRSDEALLHDYRRIATTADTSRRSLGSSVRAVVNSVLGAVAGGAALEAVPANDADFTVTSQVKNLVKNPRAGNAYTGWNSTYSAGARTITTPAAGGPRADTPSFARATVTTAITGGYTTYILEADVPVTPGLTYRLSVDVRSSVAAQIRLGFSTYLGATLLSGSSSVVGTLVTNTWARYSLSYTVVAGSGADRMRVYIETPTTLPAAATFDVTGWRLSPDAPGDVSTYFDGAKGTDTYYSYVWDGTAHQSTSTRIKNDDRDDYLLDWQIGETAWDYLAPMLAAAGLRLFCDEDRKWRLVSAAYAVAGTITVATADNLTGGSDEQDRSSLARADGYATGIIYRYRYRRENVDYERLDVAGVSGFGYIVDIRGPWPGAGAAAAHLARVANMIRQLPVTAVTDLDATPSQAAAVTVPDLVPQTGHITAVTFNDDTTMSLRLAKVQAA